MINPYDWSIIKAIDEAISIKEFFSDLIVPTSLDDFIISREIPKGFVKYCIDNKKEFSNKELKAFEEKKSVKLYQKKLEHWH